MTEKRKDLSKIGFGIAAMFGIVWVYEFFIKPNIVFNITWLETLIPTAILYGIGLPVLLLILGKTPNRKEVEKNRLSAKQFMALLSLQYTAFLLLILLSLLGVAIFGLPTGEQPTFGLDAVSIFILLLFNPVAEEFVFRKLIADKLRRYDDKLFIFISAFCFAIVHGVAIGLPQVVYTFILGLIWAYALVKTGNMIYPIILHALSNFLNNTVSLMLGDMAGIYTILSLLIGLITLILWIANRKKINVEGSAGVIHIKDMKHFVTNPGLLLYILLTVSMIFVKKMIL